MADSNAIGEGIAQWSSDTNSKTDPLALVREKAATLLERYMLHYPPSVRHIRALEAVDLLNKLSAQAAFAALEGDWVLVPKRREFASAREREEWAREFIGSWGAAPTPRGGEQNG